MSTDDVYEPTTSVVRGSYIYGVWPDDKDAAAEFDRWLERVRREARAEGWDRREDDLTSTLNPYRDEEP